MGTLSYMAPEVLQGGSGDGKFKVWLDSATDFFIHVDLEVTVFFYFFTWMIGLTPYGGHIND